MGAVKSNLAPGTMFSLIGRCLLRNRLHTGMPGHYLPVESELLLLGEPKNRGGFFLGSDFHSRREIYSPKNCEKQKQASCLLFTKQP
jgi:hypothetical protein